MRVIPTILLLCLTALLCAEVTVTVEPGVVAKGETFMLWLHNDGREAPQIANFPEVKGIRWYPNSRSSRTRIINGRSTSSIGYQGEALAEGNIEIPELKVIVGRNTVSTKPLKLEVVSAGQIRQTGQQRRGQQDKEEGVALGDAIFVEGRFPGGDRPVYIGEEIPLEFTLYIMEGVRAGMTQLPDFKFDKVAFHDYKDSQMGPRIAGEPTRTHVVRDNIRFVALTFRSALRPLATGEMKGAIAMELEVQIPDRGRRRSSIWDDDFDSFFSFGSTRRVKHTASFEFPALQVKALPPAPAGADFLGLIGDWKLEYSLSQSEFRAGDPFTLTLELNGRGSPDTLNAPKLEFPGFRVYPPEIEKKSGSALLKYVIIPLRPGKDTLRLKTSLFDLNKETYRTFDFEQAIEVLPASNPVQGVSPSQLVVEGAAKTDNGVKTEPAAAPRSNILYLKKNTSHTVAHPLYLNNPAWLLILIFLGPLVFVIGEIRRLRKDKLNSDPAIPRRRRALAARGKVRRILKKTPPENIHHAIQAEVVPLLNDYLGLPPGTTATELADTVGDPELADCLRHSGNAGYMPGAAAMDHSELKKKILKALKYVALLMCLLIPAGLHAMGEAEAAAFNAYDNGDFTAAADYFRSQLKPGAPSPGLLYNLGNALCQSGKTGEALACYEKARLLAPRDTDITENLNYVRRLLLQPETGRITNPGELVLYLRDNLRPDNWLLILAGAWSGLWLLAACRRRLGFNRKLLSFIIIGLAAILAAMALFTQLRGPYAGNQAIVLHSGTKLRSLPSDQSGKVERTLREGDRVNIVESRRDWVLVRVENAEGWLQSNDMEQVKN